MTSHATPEFWHCYRKLPRYVQAQAREAYRHFVRDRSHPGLHFKPTKRNPDIYSVRITVGYRALGVRDGSRMIWFWIGSHASYERLLADL